MQTPRLRSRIAPKLPLLASALLSVACQPETPDVGLGPTATPLTTAEMANAMGGVAASIVRPRAGQRVVVDNVRLEANVFNNQGQSQTTLLLHHGTSKTGTRVVATPAPGYVGQLSSRYKHLGGEEDLVVKYYDIQSGTIRTAGTIQGVKMKRSIKLRRLHVHNVSAATPVGGLPTRADVAGAFIESLVDSQQASAYASPYTSIDGILAQCPDSIQTQFQLPGQDTGAALHRIEASSACATLAADVRAQGNSDNVQYFGTSTVCMAELNAARAEVDPNLTGFHVFIVESLAPRLNGFISSLAQGAVISQQSLEDSSRGPGWAAALLLHEIAHGAGHGDVDTSVDFDRCSSSDPSLRALMCPGASIGQKLSAADCQRIYDVFDALANLNQ